MKRLLAVVLAAFALTATLHGQEAKPLPDSIFYWYPEFSKGRVFFSDGRAPADGAYNICAVDNTIRFKDRNGTELQADMAGVGKVIIGDRTFVFRDGVFYRLTPVSEDYALADTREITVMNDSNMAGYGMASQTTAVTTYNSIVGEGRVLSLEEMKEYPYRFSTSYFLYSYNDGRIKPIGKKNLQKAFPDKKTRVDDWFSRNRRVVGMEDALSLLRSLSE